ncbi:MAG TPA: SMC-Scp complex subunit ScpB [Chitinophagaceae bacterium]|jgi:segregation and condensation protein B|nr:SMC-Scp complex subunit ScpB [Chitinophagaceae bacterium]
MDISNLIPHIESLIFASEKPLTSAEITELINSAFGFMEDKVETEQIDAALEGIVEKYRSEFYPFEVRQSGGGWQFLTKKEFHKTVAQLNGEKFLKRLSGAALETLAIIAYKQPITKGEIEGIRGVSTDYTIQKLLEKELIIISGRNEQMPGHPLVYATSKTFMDYFGLNSTDDLPRIREVLADQLVEPTVVNHTSFDPSDTLAVSDSGELIDVAEDEAAPGSAAPDEAATPDGEPEAAENTEALSGTEGETDTELTGSSAEAEDGSDAGTEEEAAGEAGAALPEEPGTVAGTPELHAIAEDLAEDLSPEEEGTGTEIDTEGPTGDALAEVSGTDAPETGDTGPEEEASGDAAADDEDLSAEAAYDTAFASTPGEEEPLDDSARLYIDDEPQDDTDRDEEEEKP